jgi:hypothetical protein
MNEQLRAESARAAEEKEQDRIRSLEQQLAAQMEQLKAKDAATQEQLKVKDEQLAEQLKAKDEQIAEKDKQIEQLIKRPRVQNNRFHIVNQQMNSFGHESLDHIPDKKYQELLRDPETSVARVVAIRHSIPENDNVSIPNVRERRWLVMEEEGGEKRWRSKDKSQVLEQLWEANAFLLESEADEETPVGARWSRWADRVRASMDAHGKLYREQLDMVEHSILDRRDDRGRASQD